MSTLRLHPAIVILEDTTAQPYALCVGFFFIARIALTFIFFQGNPVAGTAANLCLSILLLIGAGLTHGSRSATRVRGAFASPVMRWVTAFLGFALLSLFWTGAQSPSVAAAYWVGMAADVALVLIMLRGDDPRATTDSLLRGAVLGACVVAALAWCSPPTDDMRLGDNAFLHPNTLGLNLGLATLFAQHLAQRSRQRLWPWTCAGCFLAITLLRTLSKTALIAFAVAEIWYLARSKDWSRRTKTLMVLVALVVLIAFSSLLSAYLDTYNNTGTGNQVETLTGRTVLWATALTMGLDAPWAGHGFDSFRNLIPAFGPFEPVHAHNELIQQFFEFGAIGILLFLGVHSSFYNLLRRSSADSLQPLAFNVLIFSLLRGAADTLSYGYSFPLWLIACLAVCLHRPSLGRSAWQ